MKIRKEGIQKKLTEIFVSINRMSRVVHSMKTYLDYTRMFLCTHSRSYSFIILITKASVLQLIIHLKQTPSNRQNLFQKNVYGLLVYIDHKYSVFFINTSRLVSKLPHSRLTMPQDTIFICKVCDWFTKVYFIKI